MKPSLQKMSETETAKLIEGAVAAYSNPNQAFWDRVQVLMDKREARKAPKVERRPVVDRRLPKLH